MTLRQIKTRLKFCTKIFYLKITNTVKVRTLCRQGIGSSFAAKF